MLVAIAKRYRALLAEEKKQNAVDNRMETNPPPMGTRPRMEIHRAPDEMASLPVAESKRGVEEILHAAKVHFGELLRRRDRGMDADYLVKDIDEALRLYREERKRSNLWTRSNTNSSALKAKVEKAIEEMQSTDADVRIRLTRGLRILEGRNE